MRLVEKTGAVYRSGFRLQVNERFTLYFPVWKNYRFKTDDKLAFFMKMIYTKIK